jgi:hypothetical protein
MKSFILAVTVFVGFVAQAQGQTYRVDERTIGPWHAGSEVMHFLEMTYNLNTGVLVTQQALAFNVNTLDQRTRDIQDRPYPFLIVYLSYKPGIEYPRRHWQWYKSYEVGVGPQGSNWGDFSSEVQVTEADPLPVMIDPLGVFGPQDNTGIFTPTEPDPIDPDPVDPDPPPSNTPGPATGGTGGSGGDGGTVPAGMVRKYALSVKLVNGTTGPQKYAVTVLSSIGQVLWQGLVFCPPNSTINYEYLASEPSTINAVLVYQGFADGSAPDTTRGNTIEGNTTPWNLNPDQDPRTFSTGGTSANIAGVPQGNRPGSSNDPNEENRHSEKIEAFRRVQNEVRDAASAIKASVADAADRGKSAAEAASAQIKNSIEFASGVMVSAVDGVKAAVQAQNQPDVGTPSTSPEAPNISGPDSFGAIPSVNDISGEAVSAINGSGDGEVLGAANSVKGTIVDVQNSLFAIRDALGLNSQLGSDPLVFSCPNPLGQGNIVLDVETFAGSWISLVRQVAAFFVAIWFVQEFISAVRSAFA